jgi:hypothetical protein
MTEKPPDHVQYALDHWRVTEDGLAWIPCGPNCPHERELDVTGVRLTAIPVSGAQIEWVGDDSETRGKEP